MENKENFLFKNNYNDFDDNKRKFKKKFKSKSYYCGNCGKFGHIYKFCNAPITSLGIILLSISSDDIKLMENLIDKFKSKNDESEEEIIYTKTEGITYEDLDDIKTFCKYKDNIKFLLIRRKHTLGYIKFVRGRYNIENVDGIIFLFKQMVLEEIKKIGTSTFDELWDELWNNNNNKFSYFNEYVSSKQKFDKLKNECDNYLNLNFYVENVTPSFNFPEWGFPKGRRNFQENDISCAIREFKEETGYLDEEFILLDKIHPIEEQFVGTNGINYKHIYYVAIASTNKVPDVDPTNKSQNSEIGAIGWYTFEEAINLIRPYHTERRKLITELYMYVINTIVDQLNRNNIEIKKNISYDA